jgi:hypothetical protein
MKYKVSWKVSRENWLPVLKMFSSMTRKERENAGPGVKIIGRWHDVVAREGVAILEAKDFAAVARFAGQWNPHLDTSIVPVLDDNAAAAFGRQVTAAHRG